MPAQKMHKFYLNSVSCRKPSLRRSYLKSEISYNSKEQQQSEHGNHIIFKSPCDSALLTYNLCMIMEFRSQSCHKPVGISDYAVDFNKNIYSNNRDY
jgi:hypothetical protein